MRIYYLNFSVDQVFVGVGKAIYKQFCFSYLVLVCLL